ncbi:MAG: glycosyltransferase family 2 protein [Cyclobacteriaceae bacterium]
MKLPTDAPTLCLLLPCYNEEEIVRDSSSQLKELFKNLINEQIIKQDSFIVFVDDGSVDKSWQIIKDINQEAPFIKGIKLSKNFGHQNALLAGLSSFQSNADCFITIDADLQDDIRTIREMVEKFSVGHDIVYGIRKKRNGDTFFKKNTALLFYKLMKAMGVDLVYNHADFRLSSKRALVELLKFSEANLFLRGIYPLLGFKTASVFYDRLQRRAGDTKYPFKKMFSFAIKGITAFSVRPLRIMTAVGFSVFMASLVASGYALYSYFFLNSVKGWMSIVLPMYLLGGIQLLFLGVLGEYLAKIYIEVKKRPQFIIEEELG